MHFTITPYSIVKWTIFWAGFIGIALFLIFWASGYRYDFKNKVLVSTGVLILKTQPKTKVEVFVNGKKENISKTPLKISLFPKEHDIEIRKEGYKTWSKKVKITSKKTTFLDDIILFKETPDQNIVDSKIKVFAQSENLEQLLYLKNQENAQEIYLVKNNGEKTKVYPKETDTSLVLGNINSFSFVGENLVLAKTEKNNYLINTSNNNILPITIMPNTTNLTFISQDEYLATLENNLIKYNFKSQEIKIIKEGVANYKVAKGKIFLISRENNSVFLESMNLDGNANNVVYEFLGNPELTDFKLIFNENQSYFSLIDAKKNLYLINPEKKEIKKIGENIAGASFSKDSTRLIYFSDYELNQIYFKKEGKDIFENGVVLRSAEKINLALFLNESSEMQHLIYATVNGKVTVVEEDGKNEGTILNDFSAGLIFDRDPQKIIALNQQGDLLYIDFHEGESIIDRLNFRN